MNAKPGPSEFSAEQFSGVYPVGMENHYWIKARCHLIRWTLSSLGLRDAQILDIGCGPGYTVKYLADYGFRCRGVDLGCPTVQKGAEQLISVGIGFEQLDKDYLSSVEVVLLLDVLEHLARPEELLSELKVRMPRLRHILVTVPARQELWTNYDEHFGHHRRYSRTEFAALLSLAGGSVELVRYFFHALYLPLRAMGWLTLKRRVSNQAPSPIWLHGLLARAFFLELRVMPAWCFGGSLFGRVEIQ
jgi:SAM-dependent methyltransferase